jgi:hypothetical protein
MNRGFICAVVILLVGTEICSGADLAIRLHLNQTVYKIGDTWRASITYQNISKHPIRLIPDLPIYPASRFHMTKVQGGGQPEFVIPGEIAVIDSESLARSAKVLQPGASMTRAIDAKVSTMLPKFYNKRDRGLYLVFSGHALKLPGGGSYDVEALIISPEKTGEAEMAKKLFGQPDVWAGSTTSAPVRMELKAARPDAINRGEARAH